ncbi:MAG TPA: hypothetical protein VGG30_06515 [Pirellulales bacterium]|jgi:hypothetical protein
MKERGILLPEVLEVLRTPNRKGLSTPAGRLRWRKNRSPNSAVDVVFIKWPDKLCIVTSILIVGLQ